MRSAMFLYFALCCSTAILVGAECDVTAIKIVLVNSQWKMVNKSTKPIVAYVIANGKKMKTMDGSPFGTYTGVFSEGATLRSGKSIDLGPKSESAARPDSFWVDYLRFSDGSTCGNTETEQGKQVASGFILENPK